MNWEGGMSLGEVIKELEKYDSDDVLNVGLSNPDSYRGYYECLMFEVKNGSTVGESLAACHAANGSTYMGYKGGEYTMGLDTECYFAQYGYSGIAITKPVLHGVLNNFYAHDEFVKMIF